jgi:hypothetical protein
MRVIINNHGKEEDKAWPRLQGCRWCHSVLRVEYEDVRSTVTGKGYRQILDKRYTCPCCKNDNIIAHNTFNPEDKLETF